MATGVRSRVENTARVAALALVTTAWAPSAVKATRIGKPGLSRVASTSRVSGSCTVTVSALRLLTHTVPSGATAMPSAPLPAGRSSTSPLARSTRATLPAVSLLT